jgi:hypothetical protein
MLGALCALAATIAAAAPASATIVSPAAGTPVTADGSFVLQAGFVSFTCTIALNATIASGTTASITGGSGSCVNASLTLESLPWQKQLLVVDGILTRGWRIDDFRITIAAPGLISCTYFGSMSGDWAVSGRDTVLTFTTRLDRIVLDVMRSSALCGRDPVFRGTLTLRGVVTA